MTITTFSFTTYGTITTWTVPFYTAGTMSAKVAGGGGGGSTGYSSGGHSGRIYGEFDLSPGTVITIVCGEGGVGGFHRIGGAGGGPAGWNGGDGGPGTGSWEAGTGWEAGGGGGGASAIDTPDGLLMVGSGGGGGGNSGYGSGNNGYNGDIGPLLPSGHTGQAGGTRQGGGGGGYLGGATSGSGSGGSSWADTGRVSNVGTYSAGYAVLVGVFITLDYLGDWVDGGVNRVSVGMILAN